ncbi:MAG: tRNA (adenosine(37)-N6)-dimethylallyltransferase MiaA [Marvinbryantia sp.]|jgi:tRNA dimethylallyltransferase
MKKKPLIILTGPTAVGKTALSISLAKAVGGEIISADSMQVYKGMNIGSAKIMPEEMQNVPHYLIDELEPNEEFHVVLFQQLAKKYMQQIWAKGKIPILVGGTGFYIQAVLYDIDFTANESDESWRQEMERLALEKGASYLHQMLQKVDPKAADEIHENNVKRVIRALEYYKESGEPISAHNARERKKESPYNAVYFVLNQDRQILYERINRRVDQMLENGLLDEVKCLQQKGYTRDMVSMQGLGYKEILDYLNGTCTFEEAVYRLKRDTRHFAKRQLTWFKRERSIIWLNREEYENEEAILEAMKNEIEKRKIMSCQ